MAERAEWQVDEAEFEQVRVRWRPAHANIHTVEYLSVEDWNGGKRWPLFSEWLPL
ncbi:hypothetical protein GCM10009570_25120 [Dietzia natronolimnaea]